MLYLFSEHCFDLIPDISVSPVRKLIISQICQHPQNLTRCEINPDLTIDTFRMALHPTDGIRWESHRPIIDREGIGWWIDPDKCTAAFYIVCAKKMHMAVYFLFLFLLLYLL